MKYIFSFIKKFIPKDIVKPLGRWKIENWKLCFLILFMDVKDSVNKTRHKGPHEKKTGKRG